MACALASPALPAHAALGLTELAGKPEEGPFTVFYPSAAPEQRLERGPFALEAAWNGAPVRGNGRLVVISHGSPASPWVHSDLARTLVQAGFIVVMPEHFADNYKDDSQPGPESWKRRPREVSRAIDVMAQDPRFASLLSLDKVGMFGMSAGGHTALTLAGGRWSPGVLKKHCETHLAEDFQTCAGLAARLDGGLFDGLKKWIVTSVNNGKLADDAWYSHTDPRIAAIAAGVPFAADFDVKSLSAPKVPLAIISARADKWLLPKFHSDRIVKACAACEHLMDIPNGSHGALISPLPPGRSGLVAELIDDPPGFERDKVVPEMHRQLVHFFTKHLVYNRPELSKKQ